MPSPWTIAEDGLELIPNYLFACAAVRIPVNGKEDDSLIVVGHHHPLEVCEGRGARVESTVAVEGSPGRRALEGDAYRR